MKILVTGSAGFIGYHMVSKLVENKGFKIYIPKLPFYICPFLDYEN